MRWCVFCGSSVGNDAAFASAARALGEALVARDIGLVYGGGSVGLMGVISATVMERGGSVIGIIPQALVDRELAQEEITDLRVVQTMHERKAMMAQLSAGFIAMPGGYGTFEEICEMITWVQLALHDKPCVLLNIDGFYDPLIAMFDRAVERGFISEANRAIVRAYPSVDALSAFLDERPAAAR